MKKYFYLLLLVLTIFYSCNIFRFAKKRKKVSKIELIDSVHSHSALVRSYSAKYMMKSNVRGLFKLTGDLKFNDSVFYLSANYLFMNILELYLTSDSVYIYMPSLNSYSVSSLEDYNNTGISIIKDLLLADLFSVIDTVSIQDFNFSSDTLYRLFYRVKDPNYEKYSILYQEFVIKKDFLPYSLTINDFLTYKDLIVFYSSYKFVSSKIILPTKLNIIYVSKDSLNFDIQLKKIKVNEKVDIQFKIPKNAKKVDNSFNYSFGNY